MAKQLPASVLQAGRDYPRDYVELSAWFPDDDACLDYLEWLRWPDGFVCPRCGTTKSWRMSDGRFWCERCRRRVSVTMGTIFHRTRTPLTVWFAVAWYMTSAKNGVSAKTLQRLLGFGSYQTAWAMLHRFRAAMVRPDRDRLREQPLRRPRPDDGAPAHGDVPRTPRGRPPQSRFLSPSSGAPRPGMS